MEEFDFYEIKEWGGMSPELFRLLAYNTHPFATTILESNIQLLDSSYLVAYGRHILGSRTEINNKATFYRRLREIHKDAVLPYCHSTAIFLSGIEDIVITNREDLEKHRGSWLYSYIIAAICEKKDMTFIRLIKYSELCWFELCINTNPCVIEFLKKNRHKIIWSVLSTNTSDAAADFLLEKEQEMDIKWISASQNTNQKITRLFPSIKERLNIKRLCGNASDDAVKLLLSEMYSFIDWETFCMNPNNYAVEHIYGMSMVNPNDKRIRWDYLCMNKNKHIIPILRNNQNKINWEIFIKNEVCFAYNYEMIELRASIFKEELIGAVFSPERIMKKISDSRVNDESDFEIINKIDF